MGGGVSLAPHLTPQPSCCFSRGSPSPRLGARNHVHKAGEASAFLPPLRRSWGPLFLSGVLLLAGWRGAGQGLWGRGAARGARRESGRPFAARASPQGACLREAGSRGESWRGWRGGPFGGNRALPGGREAAWSCGAGQPPRGLFAWRVWREGVPGLGTPVGSKLGCQLSQGPRFSPSYRRRERVPPSCRMCSASSFRCLLSVKMVFPLEATPKMSPFTRLRRNFSAGCVGL